MFVFSTASIPASRREEEFQYYYRGSWELVFCNFAICGQGMDPYDLIKRIIQKKYTVTVFAVAHQYGMAFPSSHLVPMLRRIIGGNSVSKIGPILKKRVTIIYRVYPLLSNVLPGCARETAGQAIAASILAPSRRPRWSSRA